MQNSVSFSLILNGPMNAKFSCLAYSFYMSWFHFLSSEIVEEFKIPSTSDFDMYQLCDFRQISLNYFPYSNFLICKIGIRSTCFIRYLQGYHKTMSNLQFQLNKNILNTIGSFILQKNLFIIHRQRGTNRKHILEILNICLFPLWESKEEKKR